MLRFAPHGLKDPIFVPESVPVLHWFRQDLRLVDNPALAAAAATGRPVLLLYILDDQTPGSWKMGGASCWWLHQSLSALANDLDARGNRLILRRGRAVSIVAELAREVGASDVFFTRRYEPFAAREELELVHLLEADGRRARRHGGNLLFEPEALTTGAGGPYKVFTPFYNAAMKTLRAQSLKSGPKKIAALKTFPAGDDLAEWRLLPRAPDWSAGIAEVWTPGEKGAEAAVDRFVEDGLAGYAEARDRPAVAGTSRLSPHLHFGEIGPRRCWQRIADGIQARTGGLGKGADAYLRELIWREFSHHLLHHWPDLADVPFRVPFAAFPWRQDLAGLRAWQKGLTGYPIVDAGMRELWHTGWMHNRVRMIAASFLVKDLLIDWREGERWFWDTLVDADLANNAAGWQWVAGSGADAAPYFRIFNPVLQGERFDPDGDYVRHWIPALARMPAKHIHAPWQAPDSVLKNADVRLGDTYPYPIVDHKAAKERALAAFRGLKAAERRLMGVDSD